MFVIYNEQWAIIPQFSNLFFVQFCVGIIVINDQHKVIAQLCQARNGYIQIFVISGCDTNDTVCFITKHIKMINKTLINCNGLVFYVIIYKVKKGKR